MRDGVALLQAGAGVVADSDPASEHVECMNKMAALRAPRSTRAGRTGVRTGRMSAARVLVLIDNYDSFTYNLAHLLCEAGAEVDVRRATTRSRPRRPTRSAPTHLVVSPGPGPAGRGRHLGGADRALRRAHAGARRLPRPPGASSRSTAAWSSAPRRLDARQGRTRSSASTADAAARRPARARSRPAATTRWRRSSRCPTVLERDGARRATARSWRVRHREHRRPARRAVPPRVGADARRATLIARNFLAMEERGMITGDARPPRWPATLSSARRRRRRDRAS